MKSKSCHNQKVNKAIAHCDVAVKEANPGGDHKGQKSTGCLLFSRRQVPETLLSPGEGNDLNTNRDHLSHHHGYLRVNVNLI